MHHTHTHTISLVLRHISELRFLLQASAHAQRLLAASLTHWAACSLIILLLQLSFAMTPARAEDTPENGYLTLYSTEGEADALALGANIELQVQGLLANMTLVQVFRNTTNHWVEGRYLFPLPPDATVRGMQISVGDRSIIGEIRPDEQAKAAYRTASEAGQIASLVDQQRPNLFTMNLANIAPGETIRVTLDIMLPVKVKDAQLQLSLPTTLTPRYTNSQTSNAQGVSSSFLQPQHARGARLDLTLTIEPLDDYSSVSSTTHTLENKPTGLKLSNTPMDRDIIINWPAQYAQDTSVHAFVTRHADERFVQLLVNPPSSVDTDERLPRELIIIVDKSGSMAGVSMKAAIEALNYAIDGLTEEDTLNLVAFDDRHYTLFAESRAANRDVKLQARRFADHLVADGGTEMAGALAFALNSSTKSVQRLRQIVFVTDGSVGYEESLLQDITSQLGNSRLFTVGIGPSPNNWFLEKAAEAGRGVSVSIRNEHDVAHSINELLDGLMYPVVTDIAVQFPDGQGEIYPQPLPDLYAKRPGMWVVKTSDDVEQIVITGKLAGERWRQTIQLPAIEERTSMALSSSVPATAMHWTRRKIDTLLDEQRYSVDPELNRHAITGLAMKAGLITPYTSFVAVEAQPVRLNNEQQTQEQVANLIPKGNQMMNISMPPGAAGVDTLTVLSLLLGISGLGLFRATRPGSHAS